MERDLLSTWCRDATRLIRFTPDRKAVREELLAHLEDHRDALIAQGMNPEKAQQEAIAAMGDPWELANQLAQVHPPFWGYAHKVTKIAALALCVLLLLKVVFFAVGVFSFYQQYNDGSLGYTVNYPNGSSVDITKHLHPDLTQSANGYLLRISHAALYQHEGDSCLTFYLQSYHLPTHRSLYSITDFYGVDDQGNRYGYSKGFTTIETEIGTCCKAQKIEFTLLSDDLQWLELRYDRDGKDIVFHIDLTGGEQP